MFLRCTIVTKLNFLSTEDFEQHFSGSIHYKRVFTASVVPYFLESGWSMVAEDEPGQFVVLRFDKV